MKNNKQYPSKNIPNDVLEKMASKVIARASIFAQSHLYGERFTYNNNLLAFLSLVSHSNVKERNFALNPDLDFPNGDIYLDKNISLTESGLGDKEQAIKLLKENREKDWGSEQNPFYTEETRNLIKNALIESIGENSILKGNGKTSSGEKPTIIMQSGANGSIDILKKLHKNNTISTDMNNAACDDFDIFNKHLKKSSFYKDYDYIRPICSGLSQIIKENTEKCITNNSLAPAVNQDGRQNKEHLRAMKKILSSWKNEKQVHIEAVALSTEETTKYSGLEHNKDPKQSAKSFAMTFRDVLLNEEYKYIDIDLYTSNGKLIFQRENKHELVNNNEAINSWYKECGIKPDKEKTQPNKQINGGKSFGTTKKEQQIDASIY